jgi:hypothetical protein
MTLQTESRIYQWFPWRLQQRFLYAISFRLRRRYERRLAERMGAIPYTLHNIWEQLFDTAWSTRMHDDPVIGCVRRIPDSWLSHVEELERISNALFDPPEYQEAMNTWSRANTSLRTASELKASQSKAKSQ